MYPYLPDYMTNSIFEADLSKLLERGVKGIAVDIDNTLVPMKTREPGQKAVEWVEKVRNAGFRICILSNARRHRTGIFMAKLGIHGIGLAGKPGRRGYRRAAKHMDLPPGQCAIMGDQLFTDIKGGVKAGFVTVLTGMLDSDEILFVKAKRIFEKKIIDRHAGEIERL